MSGTLALSLFLVAALVCAVAEGLIVRATIRAVRTPPVSGSTFPSQRTALEITWAVLPAIALGVVLALTWNAVQRSTSTRAATPASESPALLPR